MFLLFTRKQRRLLSLVAVFLGGAILAGGIASALLFVFLASNLPRPETLRNKPVRESSKIFDRTGTVLLYEIQGDVRREYVPLSSVSDNFTKALIVAEDRNFYSHIGIDVKAIVRAILTNLKLREITGGASTISQQFTRNSLLTNERTYARKIKEILLTLELERRYSKDQILEFYINQVSFGSNVYGVESASSFYFNKNSSDLSLQEASLLAAIPKAPSLLSPFGKEQSRLFTRQNYIIDQMFELGKITRNEFWNTKKDILVFEKNISPIRAPHFVMFVKQYLDENYGDELFSQGGLTIYTTLDWKIQQIAERKVKDGALRNMQFHAANAALVMLDVKTGEILAMVGSKDWFGDPYPKNCVSGKTCLFDPKVNVATSRNPGRQPGSAFKPIVYAAAFQKGYSPETIVVDEETNFGTFNGKPYIPQNYDGIFRGPVSLRAALAQSLNVPSVKVLEFVGVKEAVRYAKDFGLSTLRDPSQYGLSLVLGGAEVTPLELTSAYGVFATGGFRVPYTPVKKIVTSRGAVVFSHSPAPQRIIPPRVAHQITSILSDNEARAPMFGQYSPLVIDGFDVAVKTGTTQNYRDAWTIGYTPSFAVGVWVGNNNNEPMAKKPGVMLATPIWNSFLKEVLPMFQKEYFSL